MLVAGLVIAGTGWVWLDPAVSLAIAALIVAGTWGLLRDSVSLSLDAVPPGIELGKVREFLSRLPGVCEVHDLHVWPMSTTETALTAHLVVPDYQGDGSLLNDAAHGLQEAFGIGHVTLQVERGNAHCHLASDDVV